MLASHALLAGAAWHLSRRTLSSEQRRFQDQKRRIEEENARALARLNALRDQLKALETSVIQAQLMLEESEE